MKMLVQLFLLHNFLHNHMRYIYRQIYNLKGKKFCLNKISFLQTAVQPKFCLLMHQMHRLHGVWIRQTLPSRYGQVWFIPCCTLCLEHHTLGSSQIQCLGLLILIFFIHLHHLHLPLHQTGMYKAGSVGSGQAIFLPFA